VYNAHFRNIADRNLNYSSIFSHLNFGFSVNHPFSAALSASAVPPLQGTRHTTVNDSEGRLHVWCWPRRNDCSAFCRQTPQVGAECPNRARSDLCGGGSVTGIPTAILGRERHLADSVLSGILTAGLLNQGMTVPVTGRVQTLF